MENNTVKNGEGLWYVSKGASSEKTEKQKEQTYGRKS